MVAGAEGVSTTVDEREGYGGGGGGSERALVILNADERRFIQQKDEFLRKKLAIRCVCVS